MFQSHNGAIAAEEVRSWTERVAKSFNPTMVRLLPDEMRVAVLFEGGFQSHNGAIAAFATFCVTLLLRLFQSHNGAIAASLFLRLSCGIVKVSIPQWCDCCP